MSTAEEIGKNMEAALEAVSKQLEVTMRQCMEKLRTDAVIIIDQNKAYATGQMRKNVLYDVTREAGRIIGVVGTTASVPYSIFKHEGTKPHWPPVEAIQKWVVQKGLVTGAAGKPTNVRALYRGLFAGGKRAKKASATLYQALSIAFLIARKISKMGTTGLPFLRLALNQNIAWITQKFEAIKI
jgi:hypothetical protein